MLGAWLKLHFFSVGKMWCLCSGQGLGTLGDMSASVPFQQRVKRLALSA